MNSNERGRITGLPGTEVSVTLYPDRLGVRTRNSIIRMLENRMLAGGYRSYAAQIARALAVKYGLQVSNCRGNGLRILGLSDVAAQMVREIVHADWIARTLENPAYREGYYKNKYEFAMDCLASCEQDFYVVLHDQESIRKVAVILAEHTTQELKDKSQHIADLLRGAEPIHLLSF